MALGNSHCGARGWDLSLPCRCDQFLQAEAGQCRGDDIRASVATCDLAGAGIS